MATTKKKTPAKRKLKKKTPQLKGIPKTEKEHIQILMNMTKRSITDNGDSIDLFFKAQLVNLTKKLEAL